MNPTFFPTPADFRAWLEEHHESESVSDEFTRRPERPRLSPLDRPARKPPGVAPPPPLRGAAETKTPRRPRGHGPGAGAARLTASSA